MTRHPDSKSGIDFTRLFSPIFVFFLLVGGLLSIGMIVSEHNTLASDSHEHEHDEVDHVVTGEPG